MSTAQRMNAKQIGELAKERLGRGGLAVGDQRVAAARRGDELGSERSPGASLKRMVAIAASACVAFAPK
jgi:hypothetical protein